jgi:large subunit ribosomal protein L5
MSETTEQTATETYVPRLRTFYREEIVPQMMERFGWTNKMAVPKFSKISVNIGVGEATEDKAALDGAIEQLRVVAGQQPVITRARKSVAGFHLRQGMPIGTKVTLRGARMYEFLDRLISVVLPRVRDFQGVSPNSFDGQGNYSLGVRDISVFPEVDPDSLKAAYGMDITIVTTANTDQEGMELLRLAGMPFRQ